MKAIGAVTRAAALAAFAFATPHALAQAPGQPQPPASEVTPDPWPKSATSNGSTFTMYQPQLDSWDDYTYKAHAVVQVLPAGSQEPAFGVVEMIAYTIVDRPNRVVYIEGITITKATFPSAPGSSSAWQAEIQSIASSGPSTMSLGSGHRGSRAQVGQDSSGERAAAHRLHATCFGARPRAR
jgi:hypothetical protein